MKLLCLLLSIFPLITFSDGRKHFWRHTSAANKLFAHTLFSKMLRSTPINENILISPYAVSAGLSMVLFGANGRTADQLIHTLRYSDIDDAQFQKGAYKHDKVARLYKKMKEQLIDLDHGFVLSAPNQLFIDKHNSVKSGYIEGIDRFFGAETSSVDFETDSQNAISIINEFVSNATNGTIKKAVSSDSVDATTKLILVSTLYFKGAWEQPFDPTLTKKGAFTTIDNRVITIPFMYGTVNTFISDTYGDCEGCLAAKIIQLPYITNSSKYKIVMELILPENTGAAALKQLEYQLDERTLYYTSSKQAKTTIQLWLPKFTLKYSTDMKETLEEMGIQDLFNSEDCDLSLINGNRDLFFTSARHETFLKVDEKGTTASAAFALQSTRASNQVFFNRPFIVILREAYTKMPLFMGRVAEPTL